MRPLILYKDSCTLDSTKRAEMGWQALTLVPLSVELDFICAQGALLVSVP